MKKSQNGDTLDPVTDWMTGTGMAKMDRTTRVARLTSMTRAATVARVTWVIRMTRVTRVNSVAGMSRMNFHHFWNA